MRSGFNSTKGESPPPTGDANRGEGIQGEPLNISSMICLLEVFFTYEGEEELC